MPDYYIINQGKLIVAHLGFATTAWWCQVEEQKDGELSIKQIDILWWAKVQPSLSRWNGGAKWNKA